MLSVIVAELFMWKLNIVSWRIDFVAISRQNRRSFRLVEIRLNGEMLIDVHDLIKGGFPLGKINDDFTAKFLWTCAFLFVYSLAGEIFLFKIVKMGLTNSRRKNSPQFLDQSKHNC